ncbi:MAG TPA: hypothetical protein PLL64_06400 [Rhodothermales bacterium]|nr:hypothetical protein [Bacteroidota bacterium]HRK73885.1 hypothetical protein [Rhodothermales bacterium]HRR08968.1 hypothetical protein [Rhodothermales bacterium]
MASSPFYISTCFTLMMALAIPACDSVEETLYFLVLPGNTWTYDRTSRFPSNGQEVQYKGVSVFTVETCTNQEGGRTCQITESFEGKRLARPIGSTLPATESPTTFTKEWFFTTTNGQLTISNQDQLSYGPYDIRLKTYIPNEITFGNIHDTTGRITFRKNTGIVRWEIDLAASSTVFYGFSIALKES